jgi:hypothetical protein
MEFETPPLPLINHCGKASFFPSSLLLFFYSNNPFTLLLLQQPFSVPFFLVLEARYPLFCTLFRSDNFLCNVLYRVVMADECMTEKEIQFHIR